jgi:hypothetical protein
MKIVFFILLFSQTCLSQNFEKKEIQINDLIVGDLYLPTKLNNPKLAIIIAGSGPTDRNGNGQGLQTDAYKMLAESLAEDLSVFTFDKRIFALFKANKIGESTLVFEDFVKDICDIVTYFRVKKYHHITLIGHSEGSLLGILAAQKDADAFISLAGAGRPIDEILYNQLMKQLPNLQPEILAILGSLKEKKEVKVENPLLVGLFSKQNQPFLMSWMQYDPQKELQKLKIPKLIVGSLKVIQVTDFEAYLLSYNNDDAKFSMLPNMTHTLKNIEKDEDQMKTYSDKNWPIAEDLIVSLRSFLITNK